jgi:hypothetical protein
VQPCIRVMLSRRLVGRELVGAEKEKDV